MAGPDVGVDADVEPALLGPGADWRTIVIRRRHLKAASRYLAHRFRELHPFEVQASLLNACNLRCVYCKCPEIKTRLMTTKQWRAIIHGLSALGTIRIKFQGGEPTLRPDFRELSAEAKASGMITSTISHGLTIASRPELLDYIDELVISLDSTRPEINDRLRGEGTYHGAVKAIDLALQRGVRTFVNMVLTRENVSDLEAMLEFCEARGVRLNAQPVIFDRKYFDNEARALELTPNQFRTVHTNLAEWKRQGRGLLFSRGSYEKAAGWPNPNELTVRSAGESSCMAGKDYIHIEPNGDVHPCGLHGADFAPKNIIKDGLEEALRHVKRHNCGDCWMPYLNERKAVFGLRPAALREVVQRG